jgi:hypothetical protein
MSDIINGVECATVYTNGFSFADIERTLAQANVQNGGLNLAAFNNINPSDITGYPTTIFIPLAWLDSTYTGQDTIYMTGNASQSNISTKGSGSANVPVLKAYSNPLNTTITAGSSGMLGASTIIKGVPDMVLYLGAGGLLLMLLMGGKKRASTRRYPKRRRGI